MSVGFPENRPIKIRIQQAARRGRKSERITNFKPEYNEKTRFTEAQIVKAIKQHEVGSKVSDICRELSISEATFYNWKARYGGMGVSDVKKMKALEEENARLKKMYAELSLVHHALKDAVEKSYKPCQ